MEHHKHHTNFPELTVKTQSLVDRNLQWAEVRTQGSHPTRRSFHVAAVYGDRMVILGGQDLGEGLTGGLWTLRIDESEAENDYWEEVQLKGEAPPPLCRHSGVQYLNQWYVFGGTDHEQESRTLFVLDFETWHWKAHTAANPTCPPLMDSHSASLFINSGTPYMVVFGGFIEGNRSNSLFLLNLETLSWEEVIPSTSQLPAPRVDHTSIVHESCMYIFGGTGEDTIKLNDLWKCDLLSYTWVRIEARGMAPTGRSGHSAVPYSGVMIIFGGVCELNRETNAMYVFDFALETWTQIQFDTIIKDPVSAVLQDDLSPAQKRSKPPLSPTKSISTSPSRQLTVARKRPALYSGPPNPTHGRITGNVPHPRDGHTAVLYGDHMYVFGGDRGQMPFNDVYAYELDETAVRTPVTAL